ncbi:MAG: Hsp33 family molecular chaperone HslO [Burkholderiales bacterium]
MADSLQKFIFEHAHIRGSIVQLGATWQAVLERHHYPPSIKNILGELMASVALLATTLKFDGSLIMQIQGDGAVKLLVVECNSDLTLRAMAQWDEASLDGLTSLRELTGSGRFVITIDPKDSRQTYQGIVELTGETVAETLQHYMETSEQLATRLWLTTANNQAAGLLLQKLPGELEMDVDAWNRAVHLASTVKSAELLLPPEKILHLLYHEEDVRLFEPIAVSFRCTCSRERVVGMLRMIGRDEVTATLKQEGKVEVTCQFCNRQYQFDAVDAEQLFASDAITPAPPIKH